MEFRPPRSSPLSSLRQTPRGMTLVELMIVVAIVGILATVAIVSYNNYIKEGRLTEMRQYAMDITRGQEQYFSRNHEYFEPGEQVYDPGADDPEWTQLLEFNPRATGDTVIAVEAGIGGSCGICDDIDPTTFHESDQAWFGVRVYDPDMEESIVMTSEHEQAVPVRGAWNPPGG